MKKLIMILTVVLVFAISAAALGGCNDNSYLGLIHFAFAIIVWRKLIPVHKGMVIVG